MSTTLQSRVLLRIILNLVVFATGTHFLRAASEAVELKTPTGTVYGTLLLPDGAPMQLPATTTVALIISGSGPTDRDGNNLFMRNNSLKMLADSLAYNGIASLRYDKRGIAASKAAMVSEDSLRFEDYVNDAAAWLSRLKSDKRFTRVIVMGHSEGSLIGMIAVERVGADAFVSLEGASEPADAVIRRQLIAAPGGLADLAFPIIDSLMNGQRVTNVPQSLQMLFRPSVQPYMMSWFKYDPMKELARLTIPILIVQGTTDIQTIEADGKALVKANPRAKLALIDGMNHVLKKAPMERSQNIKVYADQTAPLMPDFVHKLMMFLH